MLYVIGGLAHLALHGRRSIYHAHDIGAAGWLAVAAARLLGGRSLVKLRTGCDVYRRRFAGGFPRWQFTRLLRLADRVVVVNSDAERFVRSLGVPRSRVLRLPNTTDTDYFRPPSAEEKAAARRSLEAAVDRTLVLYCGRFEHLKGVDILLRAWARIPRPLRERAHLVLVGDGPQKQQLVELVESLALSEYVALHGFTDDVRGYYWSADLFVLPSRTEGLSNALVEAMASGLPVVASSVGGAVDLVENGVHGQLFPAEDHAGLAAALERILMNRNRWPAMGHRARQRVVEGARGGTLDRMTAVYRDLWSNRSAS
jgi:glycosyltransferase involved in cell wall biosynthesis